MHPKLGFQDFTAMVVSLILTIALCALAFTSRDVPPALTMALGSAMTWLFIRTTASKLPPGDTTTVESSGATETTVRDLPESNVRLRSSSWPTPLVTEVDPSQPRTMGRRSPWEDAVHGRWSERA